MTRRTPSRLSRLFAVATIGGAFVLTGCGTDNPSSPSLDSIVPGHLDPSALAPSDVTAAPAEENPEPVEPTPTEPEPRESEPVPAEPEASAEAVDPAHTGGMACLTGTWQVDNASFEEMMLGFVTTTPEVPAHLVGDGSFTVTGASFVRFDGADMYSSWQEAFGFSWGGGAVTHVQDSIELGTYGADDKYVWISDVQVLHLEAVMNVEGIGSVELDRNSDTASVNLFGVSSELPAPNLEGADGAAGYECEGDTLVLYPGGASPVELFRFTE